MSLEPPAFDEAASREPGCKLLNGCAESNRMAWGIVD